MLWPTWRFRLTWDLPQCCFLLPVSETINYHSVLYRMHISYYTREWQHGCLGITVNIPFYLRPHLSQTDIRSISARNNYLRIREDFCFSIDQWEFLTIFFFFYLMRVKIIRKQQKHFINHTFIIKIFWYLHGRQSCRLKNKNFPDLVSGMRYFGLPDNTYVLYYAYNLDPLTKNREIDWSEDFRYCVTEVGLAWQRSPSKPRLLPDRPYTDKIQRY